ncbi:hypothetical protein [Bdellovibrio sp. HCB274]|uniref:hypothetical protein n=1 Tax=Bdellovibrio sp. HCB274 TaxID=3394361 RepID=UPI0039B58924
MKTCVLLLQTLIVTFALSGCGYALEEMGLFKTGEIILKTPKVNEFSESLIDYYVVRQTALKTCFECHTTKAPLLDTEAKIYEHREDIMATVESGDMPPIRKGYQPLTACELQILRSYFDNQTNQRPAQRVKELSACTEGTKPPTQPTSPVPNPPEQTPQPDLGQLELSFKNLRTAFFDAKCLNCHSSQVERPKDPMLDSIAHILAAKDYTDKSITVYKNGADSLLYKITVPGLTDTIMPPARTKVQLTPAEADYLKRWIDAGMPE